MTNEQMERLVKKAVNQGLPGVGAGERTKNRLYQNVLEGKKMKRLSGWTLPGGKRVSFAMTVLLAVLLISGAVAAALLPPREVLEKEAIPLAVGNDSGGLVNNEYSNDDLAKLVAALAENGFTLDENDEVLRALRRGDGYWEEETVMAVCRKAFGGSLNEWTAEQQHWFGDMMVKMNYAEENDFELPGENALGDDEALKLAVNEMKTAFPAYDFTDKSAFRVERVYQEESGWEFTFTRRSVYGGTYRVQFEKDGKNPVWTAEQPGDDFTDADVVDRMMPAAYGYGAGHWPQEAFHEMEEALGRAKETEDARAEIKGYKMTRYPIPGAGDLSREDAVRAALAAVGEGAWADTAVLMEDDANRLWKVQAVESGKGNEKRTLVEIDGKSGAVLGTHVMTEEDSRDLPFMTAKIYEQVTAGRPGREEVIKIAVETAEKEAGQALHLTDESRYALDIMNGRDWTVRFLPKGIEAGRVAVMVNKETGKARCVTLDTEPLTADNLLMRMRNVYESEDKWTEDMRLLFEEKARTLNAQTLTGRVYQATRYGRAADAKISREEAQLAAVRASGQNSAEAWSGVLIKTDEDALVWKVRVLTSPLTTLYEIDAQTGEVLNREPFVSDNTDIDPSCKIYSLRRTFWRLSKAEKGLVPSAAREVSLVYGNKELDDPTLSELFDKSLYTVKEEESKVSFIAGVKGWPSFFVSFDADGVPVKTEKTEGSMENFGEDRG